MDRSLWEDHHPMARNVATRQNISIIARAQTNKPRVDVVETPRLPVSVQPRIPEGPHHPHGGRQLAARKLNDFLRELYLISPKDNYQSEQTQPPTSSILSPFLSFGGARAAIKCPPPFNGV